MLHVVDEAELNVKLTQDDIRDLVIDPPDEVFETTKFVSLYSLRMYKLSFHAIKMSKLKRRALDVRIKEMQKKKVRTG